MKKQFKFIDLFAGIGGFHIAMESIGGECVFASEIDSFARKTYEHNFKKSSPTLFENGMFNDDIRKISPTDIPDFDILCAGFPCQPFSQAGHKRGFDDTHRSERGNLFFNIVDILEAKKPKAFFLENVRGIVNHDNGNTFKTIRKIIEDELGYSFHYKVVKASDYGLPQLRPRAFMIGFKNEGVLSSFQFPPSIPLKFNMSDVWGEECSREIGFTLRVGGRGSNINDRRNWDSYNVGGKVKKIMPEQAIKMQGFPENFEFPVAKTQTMKQLGNSVAIDAIRECAKVMLRHLSTLNNFGVNMSNTKNKGEWTELYTFLKLVNDKKLMLADKNLEVKNDADHFNVTKVSTLNIQEDCYLKSDSKVVVKNIKTGIKKEIDTSSFLNNKTLNNLVDCIKDGGGSFEIPEFNVIQDQLGISIINGGNSNQKSDIVLDVHNSSVTAKDEGFGIKSYLGSKPTLLNASGNTNFIYRVTGIDNSYIDEINSIDSRTKIKDRIEKIFQLGGKLEFFKIEKDTMAYNLNLVDGIIPDLMSQMLLEFFVGRTSSISANVENVFNSGVIASSDLASLQVKVKRLLVSVLLGFFAGTKWNGKYESNGTIVVKNNGDQVGFHIIDMETLEDYLFENIRFDTPSSTRHRYGSLVIETDQQAYFKLNLQLRF